MNPENQKSKSYGGYSAKDPLFFLGIFAAIICLFIALFHFSFLPHFSSLSKNERWGAKNTNKPVPLAPESDPDKIITNISKAQKAIHSTVLDGRYGHINFSDFDSPLNLSLNQNYKVEGDNFEIVFHIRTTPDACSDVAHYLLDEYNVDVNGFRPGGKGVLAKKVIESCKSGLLTVKTQ